MNYTTSKLFKYVRKEKALNQSQFADKLKVNQSTISRIESRIIAPSSALLNKLYAFTGKSLKELIEDIKTHP